MSDTDKPTLRLLPKPEGFELRDKRCAKTGDAVNWTPVDALYAASKMTDGKEVTQLVVYWWEKDPTTGKELLRYSNATTSRVEHAYILQKALHALLTN